MSASSPSALSSRLSIGFSWAGHAYMHILTGLFLTIVLALEDVWTLDYDKLIRLWTFGSLLVGVGAPLAGWLGDRWSNAWMMVVFFVLTGAGAVAAGFADGPDRLWLGLAVLGLGAAIYHPVGLSWVVRNADAPGKALGYLGVFGSIGLATPALIAATLIDLVDWRAAFVVPGVISIVTGLALAGAILGGLIVERATDRRPQPPPARGDVLRAFLALSVTMLSAGVIWNALQVAVPKWFDAELGAWVGDSTLGVGGLVTIAYLVAALPQVLGGHFADRFPIKRVFVACLALQVTVLGLAAGTAGPATLAVAMVILAALALQIPAENVLLARYTPGRHRGLAYGAKFVLSFGAGPVAVQMVAALYEWTGDFDGLFVVLSVLAASAVAAAVMLPADRPSQTAVAAA